MSSYSYINNAEGGYLDNLYNEYKTNPENVDTEWRKFFEGVDFASTLNNALPSSGQTTTDHPDNIKVLNLINGYRSRAHLLSTTNPIRHRKDRHPHLDLADYQLTEADLDVTFAAGQEIGLPNASLRAIIEKLNLLYAGDIGVEYTYIDNTIEREWFKNEYESTVLNRKIPIEKETKILQKLNEAVVFENFLHTRFVGQKRFSLEGGETTIAALDAIITKAAEVDCKEVIIGMAHRGRLNVLANILGKTYEYIFTEFEGIKDADESYGDGDVKYHLGFISQLEPISGKKLYLKLVPNPSHLEAVNSVVGGFSRGKSDSLYEGNAKSILPVLIHGDAALAGQGVVYEVAQMSQLPGYYNGGTIHFVINNQIGFTTDFDDARTSTYCTGVAKVTDCPIIHVNGDDPEAVVYAVELAVKYRNVFSKDVYVDMVCYRRWGHNESDEPKFTQPALYELIANHPNPRDVYSQKLIAKGDIHAELAKKMDEDFRKMLQDRLNAVKQNPLPYEPQPTETAWDTMTKAKPEDFDSSPATGVDKKVLDKIIKAITSTPSDVTPIAKVVKMLDDRNKKYKDNKLDWALGELLAYGSLLMENIPVRMSGQDVIRGTFSHRHAGVFDEKTEKKYIGLNFINDKQSKIQIYNSLLSEYAVLGFEYGYSLAYPHQLNIWEAQFGDFSNGAQVMIDQFISSAESKWMRMSGLVMLLPHGYEGQGPEHSSARPERYLQLAAEYNLIIGNFTTPANMFHALRRQVKWNFRKPMIVMTPKSLLRSPLAVSTVDELVNGKFQEVIDDTFVTSKSVKRVLFCTGKIYYDLMQYQQANNRKDVAIVRIEQLYPMPEGQIDAILAKYPKAEYIWVQEEPKNMGAWTYWLRREDHISKFKLISRKASASPATGFAKVHNDQQNEIINNAFDLSK